MLNMKSLYINRSTLFPLMYNLYFRFNRLYLLRHCGHQRPRDLCTAHHCWSVTWSHYTSATTWIISARRPRYTHICIKMIWTQKFANRFMEVTGQRSSSSHKSTLNIIYYILSVGVQFLSYLRNPRKKNACGISSGPRN